MKRMLVVFMGALAALSGCCLFIPAECRYLKSAEGTATIADIRQRLGTPIVESIATTGETVWVYEVREEQPFHRGTPTGFWCDEYRLAFDRDKVLRRWDHRSFFHGGVFRPEPCRAGYERPAL